MATINVLHLITKLELGGAQKNTLHTVQLLDKKRYRVLLAAGPGGELFEEAKKLSDVPFTVIPSLRREIHPLHDVRALVDLVRLLRRERVHIIHTHSSKAGILGRAAAHLAKTPIIIHTFHGFGFHDWQHPLLKRYYVGLERWAAKVSHKLVTVSRFNTDKALAHGIGRPEQYLEIHSGVEVDRFLQVGESERAAIRREWGIADEEVLVAQIANFKPQKNPLDFVRMAHQVLQHEERCRFVMVGDGPLRPQVEALIEELGLSRQVRLTGWREDIPQIMAAMDILVLTSLWEGLPQVFPQAMASGKPIVANKVDGAPEAIAHGVNGFLVEPGDYKGMAEYVLTLARDKELRLRMGAEGRQRVRPTFCVRTMVEKIAHLYEELLKGAPSDSSFQHLSTN